MGALRRLHRGVHGGLKLDCNLVNLNRPERQGGEHIVCFQCGGNKHGGDRWQRIEHTKRLRGSAGYGKNGSRTTENGTTTIAQRQQGTGHLEATQFLFYFLGIHRQLSGDAIDIADQICQICPCECKRRERDTAKAQGDTRSRRNRGEQGLKARSQMPKARMSAARRSIRWMSVMVHHLRRMSKGKVCVSLDSTS